ncbi:hypothetical protein ACFPTR_11450 [Aliibacillus thermotolerans]|uniref:ATP-binding protein n=1 Tax=Aliibacillus thermotolerans TaxID=1834418 RepID=A0ABW0U7L6_9BACI|nr:hypothetical protein [Aliibacillus thermotolerans]MDA3129793.1 hypothetical protein [Aliibacillus thermotolerans]
MIIYGLYGPSGTGKSSSALYFAYEKRIQAIIDDGLFIYKGKRIAGTSAKFENNVITAVKRATFYFDDHRQEVTEAIRFHAIDKLLIIGTSQKMVDKIAKQLEIGPIDHYVHIQEIRSLSEMKLAQYIRQTEGKHVIPISASQIEQSFFKRLISKGKKIFSPKKELIGETTIVHPDFTQGIIHISDDVFYDIVKIETRHIEGVKACSKVKIDFQSLPVVDVSIHLQHPLPRPVKEISIDIQKKIVSAFRRYLELQVDKVHLHLEK